MPKKNIAARTAIIALRRNLDMLEAALSGLEHDAELGHSVRELAGTTPVSRGKQTTPKPAKNGARGRKAASPQSPRKPKVTDEQIVSAIRTSAKRGMTSADLVKATGLTNEALRYRLGTLRKQGTVSKKGKTSSTRYFAASN